MSIRIEVEVPADLEVVRDSEPRRISMTDGRWLYRYDPTEQNWQAKVMQQIAAAVEARKPRPPKFGVGDVVEWHDPHNGPMAGFVDKWWTTDGLYEYRLHGYRPYFHEADLTLVRRAAK